MDFGSKLLDKRVRILEIIKENPTNVNRLVLNHDINLTSQKGMKSVTDSLLDMDFIELAPGDKREHKFKITSKGKRFLNFMEKTV